MHAHLVASSESLPPPGPDVLEIRPDPSIGIEAVRLITHFLSRKPTQSSQNTVIMYQADKLTLPAQNALLKTLEEPPGNSQIYLVTAQPDLLLPTILSRVQIQNTANTLQPTTDSQVVADFLKASTPKDRLTLLDSQSFTRETALTFLDDLEYFLHQHIHTPIKYAVILQTRTYLHANCNLKLSLDYLALGLNTP